jgi:O-antigen biosynthesis protein WbqP
MTKDGATIVRHGRLKRCVDLAFALTALAILAIPMILIALMVRLTSPGPALYWSRRVGKDNAIFWMPKFRSMRTGTPQLATHLLTNSEQFITPVGHLLRVTSLDEMPQLYNILRGDMSVVGPRPALFNQDDLIALRTECGVSPLVPGLTGWAQVNGRDELSIPEKVALDEYYLHHQSLGFDLWIMVLTGVRVLRRDGIAQAGEETRRKAA